MKLFKIVSSVNAIELEITYNPGPSSNLTFRLVNTSRTVSSSQSNLISSRTEASVVAVSSSRSWSWSSFIGVRGDSGASLPDANREDGGEWCRILRSRSRADFQPLDELIENSDNPRREDDAEEEGWSKGAAVLTEVDWSSRLAEPSLSSRLRCRAARGSKLWRSCWCFSVNLMRARVLAGRGDSKSSWDPSGLKGMSNISLERWERTMLMFRMRLRKMTGRHAAFSSDHSLRA